MKISFRVIIFYVTTFLFTGLLSTLQTVLGITAQGVTMPQLGPGLAALIMLLLFRVDKKEISIYSKTVTARKYLGAFALPLVVIGLTFALYTFLVHPLSLPVKNTSGIVVMVLGMIAGAFGEELGWRGYLQSSLDDRLGGIIAPLIVGPLWALWHVGSYSNGGWFMGFFLLVLMGISVVMSWWIRKTGMNVLLAALFHFGVNVGFYLCFNALTDWRLMAICAVFWCLAAVALIIFKRKELMDPAG